MTTKTLTNFSSTLKSTGGVLQVDVEKGYQVVDVLNQIAQNYGALPAQVAIACILTKPFISSILIGANQIQHLDDNLGTVEFE